jgi:hypothetical protein
MQMDTEENNRFLFLSWIMDLRLPWLVRRCSCAGTYLPRTQKNEPINNKKTNTERDRTHRFVATSQSCPSHSAAIPGRSHLIQNPARTIPGRQRRSRLMRRKTRGDDVSSFRVRFFVSLCSERLMIHDATIVWVYTLCFLVYSSQVKFRLGLLLSFRGWEIYIST